MLDDRPLPSNIKLETDFLSGIFNYPDIYWKVCNLFKAEIFYDKLNRKIAQTIIVLNTLDVSLITNEHRTNIDIIVRINEMMSIYPTGEIETWFYVLYELYIRREYIKISENTILSAYNEKLDISNLINKSISDFNSVSSIKLDTSEITKDLIDKVLNELSLRIESFDSGTPNGVTCGLNDLDSILTGYKTGLHLIAGRPSMGKTAFAVFYARQAARLGRTVYYLTPEMSKVQIIDRMILGLSNVDGYKYQIGNLNNEELNKIGNSMKEIKNYKIYIDDNKFPSIQYIHGKSIDFKRKKIEILFIDYLNLMELPFEYRGDKNKGYGEITRQLKILSGILDIPIVLLSQLNRDSVKGSHRKPRLDDIRDSGEVEANIDTALFIHREDYYKDGDNPDFIVDLILAKHRNGNIGNVKVKCNMSKSDFVNYDKNYF
jgi:replicative DNA helicase